MNLLFFWLLKKYSYQKEKLYIHINKKTIILLRSLVNHVILYDIRFMFAQLKVNLCQFLFFIRCWYWISIKILERVSVNLFCL